MNKMNINQLVRYFNGKGHRMTAQFIGSFDRMPDIAEDGWIEEGFIRRHLGVKNTEAGNKFWRDVQANVTILMGCDQ